MKIELLAFQSGELYINKALLVADRAAEILIYCGTDKFYDAWRDASEARGRNVLEVLSEKYGQPFTSRQQVEAYIAPILLAKAQEMESFFTSSLPFNISKPNRVRIVRGEGSTSIQGSTEAVTRHFEPNPVRAQRELHANVADSLHYGDLRGRLRDFYLALGFSSHEHYALFWGRTSGRTNAAKPYLDTNAVMLAQMLVSVRSMDPRRKLIQIGDPIHLPAYVGDVPVPAWDMNLTEYWRRADFPDGGHAAQMFFMSLLQVHHPSIISVGTNSGVLEIPHLLGMRTIYLENDHDHLYKGKRWIKKLRIGNIARLTTTTATDFNSKRAVLFEEVRDWLKKRAPGGFNDTQDSFLQQLIRLAQMDEITNRQLGRGDDGLFPHVRELRSFASAWQPIRSEPFSGGLAAAALDVIDDLEHSNGLTPQQLEKFEEYWQAFLELDEEQEDADEFIREHWVKIMHDPSPDAPRAPDTSSLDPSL